MDITVFVKAEVKDVVGWKDMSDDLEHQRQLIKINFKAYKNEESPNYSYVLGTAPLEKTSRDSFNSPERQAIQKSMMLAPPEITFLQECQ